MKIKVTYIISNIDKALAFEWAALHLDKTKIEISFILLNPEKSYLQEFLEKNNIPVLHIPYHGKKDLMKSIRKTRTFLKTNQTEVVHTHLFDANVVGLTAAKLVGIKKRIHTRHHSSLHHMYFPRAVYYDKYINRLSTNIVAITEKVQTILLDWEKTPANKVEIIHHGFDLNLFQNPQEEIITGLKEKYNIDNQSPIFGVIARYTHWKGIQYIIPAFKKFLNSYPSAHLILANAQGDFEKEIKDLLKDIPKENYTEIKFETEIASLYRLFDFYIHTPIDDHSEAFGQTYIESLASEVPSIFSLSGVASEFIEHEKNALVVKHQNSEDLYDKMIQLVENKNLQEALIMNGKKSSESFALAPFMEKLTNLYLR
ncbi:MAG: glycosyltransferase family 4 protein [Cytophagales bacterium]|nr:glycosyltransferase family 4 protein [Cytophagales bacterium]